MLTFSRREGESLYICPTDDADLNMTLGELFTAGAIELSINMINDTQVSIALNAPTELLILRDESLASVDT